MKSTSNNNTIIKNQKSNYYFSAIVSSCYCLCVLLYSKLIKLIQTKIQILRNRMQEQNFYVSYFSILLLQNSNNVIINKYIIHNSYFNYNCETNFLYLQYNLYSFVFNFENTILTYLRKMQKGARTNGI